MLFPYFPFPSATFRNTLLPIPLLPSPPSLLRQTHSLSLSLSLCPLCLLVLRVIVVVLSGGKEHTSLGVRGREARIFFPSQIFFSLCTSGNSVPLPTCSHFFFLPEYVCARTVLRMGTQVTQPPCYSLTNIYIHIDWYDWYEVRVCQGCVYAYMW